MLNKEEPEIYNFVLTKNNSSMKHLIIAAMLQMPNNKGQVKEIKAKLLQMFPDRFQNHN